MRAVTAVVLGCLVGCLVACSSSPPAGGPTDSGGATGSGAAGSGGSGAGATGSGGSGPAGAAPLVDLLAGKHVLWVGAHPDDESTVAPLLGEACRERGATCTFLLATRGEAGTCEASVVCSPDVASYRAKEMTAAAALYRNTAAGVGGVAGAGGAATGTVVQFGLADGSAGAPEQVAAKWAASKGGTPALVEAFRAAIVAAAPDYVVTFDPRHGTTCHPDHRAAAAVTLLALKQLGSQAPVAWLSEVSLREGAGGVSIGYVQAVPSDAQVLSYDATRVLPSLGGTAWDFLLENLRAHQSQFSAARLAGFASAPETERRVFVLPLKDSRDPDARYVLCP